MKKIFIFFFSLFCFFCFCGCNSNNTISSATTLDDAVCFDLENTEGIQNMSDETKKALSVIYRTNHQINNDYLNTPQYSTNKNLKHLVYETSGETLNENENIAFDVDNEKEYTWEKSIKKADLLKYLYKKNISLANISTIEPIKDDNNKLKEIKIGGKTIPFDDVENEFDLDSNDIFDIKTTKNEIILFGKGKNNSKTFNTYRAEQLSKEGFSYKEILKKMFDKKEK